MKDKSEIRTLANELAPLVGEVKWGGVAKKYIGKSPSWMYNKILGRDGNGGIGGFTPEEVECVRTAMLEFANDIVRVAKSL